MIAKSLEVLYRNMKDSEAQEIRSCLRNRDVMWAYIRRPETTKADVLKYLAVEYCNKQRIRIVKDLHSKYCGMVQQDEWQDLLNNCMEVDRG